MSPKMLHVSTPRAQAGVSMLIVLVIMMLSMLLVLGTSKLALLNEQMSGNNSDYQRTYEAAEAVLRDAAIDVACFGSSTACVNRAPPLASFRCDVPGFMDLMSNIEANNPPCRDGICTDLGQLTLGNPDTSFWSPKSSVNRLADFTANRVAARYGQFTNETPVSGTTVNPLLANNAWYWIEVLKWTSALEGSQTFVRGKELKPDTSCPFAFRVTALAKGTRPGNTAVLQSIYMLRDPN